VIEDIKILEAVERYISGQMTPDERVHFEQLRKSNPEVDQMVVEHTFFLQQMNRFDDVKKFKNILNDTHIHLGEKGLIKAPRLKGKAKVVYLYNRYKRVSAIAASIAGIVALTISAIVWQISPARPANQKDIENLSRDIRNISQKVTQVQKQNQALNQKIDVVKEQSPSEADIPYTTGGTGFLIDSKGYLVTNAHVVSGAEHVAVQSGNGRDLRAKVVYVDMAKDIAILKITDKNYKPVSSIPYSIKRSSGDLAESIFTLGYPRNDIVYGDGYIAAKTGVDGDTLSCQITIAANKGNSGSPILNKNGEVIGILSKKENSVEGAVFALRSKYIIEALNELQKDSSYKNIKLPTSSTLKGKDRTQQVKTISDYVFMVKVD
jgi:S1-C subfamily serine protease